ncbi:predicted protein [Naegleria gruberi]|uniref:Predicted protein n=1 Tax=Naegleria gruberi TaxID=5762 RepID=D2V0N2_NAEGR|nr:uncharacterized protein NAEGRDRAFT_45733 [Naegleria gruberi]EFC49753.1 predicted protein [Naegleria gruberi]|eukprot:XP_002682497.1 predicted protein [Naegleria gruberi strain NEG-M]
MHPSSHPVFGQELIVEKILSFSNVVDWLRNEPPLISRTFSTVFSSEHFARLYMANVLNLTSEQVGLLENMVNGKVSDNRLLKNYESMQSLFKEFVSNSLIPKRNLTSLVSKFCANDTTYAKEIEDTISKITMAVEIREKLCSQYYNCDLIINDGGTTYEIKDVSQFWKGGECKQIFVHSIEKLKPELTAKIGGYEIEATIYMGFGYPLQFLFCGTYQHFEGTTHFDESVSVFDNLIFYSEECYTEGTRVETFEIMNHFISVEQDQIPPELNAERVYNTLCYHWYWPFLHGKSKMTNKFKETMKKLDFDDPVIYVDSYMRESDSNSANKRKLKESSQAKSGTKKSKH